MGGLSCWILDIFVGIELGSLRCSNEHTVLNSSHCSSDSTYAPYLLKVWWYTHDLTWVKETDDLHTSPVNWLPGLIYVYEISTDCVSDAILIFFPIRLLWGIKLPTNQRRMIMTIFSSSIVLTVVSIFRTVAQLNNILPLAGLAIDIEVACSIIVCNLLVTVTLIYRISRAVKVTVPGHDPEDDDFTAPVMTRVTPPLTTVNFSSLYSSEDNSQGCASDDDKSSPFDPVRFPRVLSLAP